MKRATPEQIRHLFPHASKSTIAANADNIGSLPDAGAKQDKAPTLGGSAKGKTEGMGGVRVRFTGYRVFPLDPDGFAASVKDLLDGLRHVGIIEGDEWWRIKLETTQKRVEHYAQEKTLIEVEYPE